MQNYCRELQPLQFMTRYSIPQNNRKLTYASKFLNLVIPLKLGNSFNAKCTDLFVVNQEFISVYTLKSSLASIFLGI